MLSVRFMVVETCDILPVGLYGKFLNGLRKWLEGPKKGPFYEAFSGSPQNSSPCLATDMHFTSTDSSR